MKSEVEMERELLLDQVNHQRSKLEADIKSLQGEESSLREKLTLVIKVGNFSHLLCHQNGRCITYSVPC